jgi:hypothetical protein
VSILLNQPWATPFGLSPAGLPRFSSLLGPGLLVQVYPNPARQWQTLSIRTGQAGLGTLLLADALGRQMSQQQLTLSPGTTTLPLAATSELAAGVYLLHVQQGSQQQTIRLVRH